jgi:hypothetical protein
MAGRSIDLGTLRWVFEPSDFLVSSPEERRLPVIRCKCGNMKTGRIGRRRCSACDRKAEVRRVKQGTHIERACVKCGAMFWVRKDYLERGDLQLRHCSINCKLDLPLKDRGRVPGLYFDKSDRRWILDVQYRGRRVRVRLGGKTVLAPEQATECGWLIREALNRRIDLDLDGDEGVWLTIAKVILSDFKSKLNKE